MSVESDQVDICNSALIKVGGARISSLSDTSQEGLLCKELFPRLCRLVLRSHPWNFAKTRVEIAAKAEAPVFGFSHQFAIPSDCLRILNVNLEYFDDQGGSYYNWQREGNSLFSNDSAIKIRYIRDVTNEPHLFDINFSESLSYRIASDLAFPLANSRQLATDMFNLYRAELSAARTFNGQEGSARQVSSRGWLNSRLG